jgi:hypothetical protein
MRLRAMKKKTMSRLHTARMNLLRHLMVFSIICPSITRPTSLPKLSKENETNKSKTLAIRLMNFVNSSNHLTYKE